MEDQSSKIPKWSALLVEAVSKPGLIMKAYSAFILIRRGIKVSARSPSVARITARPD